MLQSNIAILISNIISQHSKSDLGLVTARTGRVHSTTITRVEISPAKIMSDVTLEIVFQNYSTLFNP